MVTPTLKAARGARAETGARTGSVAWLVFQHGWRWDPAGRWTRLHPGQHDPVTDTTYTGPHPDAQLRPADLVVVDEAGMLDQDTARALLVVVDEQRARLALVGDPHQLAAIGRGGVLDLAGRWAQRAVTLDVIHRFTRAAEIEPGVLADVEDTAYAALSLRIREGAAGDPGAVFDALAARGQVHLHPTGEELRTSVAARVAAGYRAGRATAVSVATNEAAGALNTAIRDQLITTGHVDDGHTGNPVATTGAGQRVGIGDRVVTRHNDRGLDVANRDTWTVTAVHRDGSLTLTPTPGSGLSGQRTLPAGYVNRYVELGYAGTIHGVQGQTAHTGLLVLDEHTSAAAAYVGMTRGRTGNHLHLIAADLPAARAQWVDTAGRGRPDLGLATARGAAERAASPYAIPAVPRPGIAATIADARLGQVLDELRAAWTEQARASEQLARLQPRLARTHADHAQYQRDEQVLAPLREHMHTTRTAAETANRHAATARTVLQQRAQQIQSSLRAHWDTDRAAVGDAARTVHAGPGRLGRLTGARNAVYDAHQLLEQWAQKWRPVLPELTDTAAAARYAARHPGNDRIGAALHDYAHRRAAQELPNQVQLLRVADRAHQTADHAADTYVQTSTPLHQRRAARHAHNGHRDLADELLHLTQQATTAHTRHQAATARIQHLTTDSAITNHDDPAGFLTTAHTHWHTEPSRV